VFISLRRFETLQLAIEKARERGAAYASARSSSPTAQRLSAAPLPSAVQSHRATQLVVIGEGVPPAILATLASQHFLGATATAVV
jgi:hypothetical protein